MRAFSATPYLFAFLLWLAALFPIAFFTHEAWAEQTPDTLSIIGQVTTDPFLYADESSHAAGFGVDIWKHLAHTHDLDMEMTLAPDWQDAVAALRGHRADIVAPVFSPENAERANLLLTAPYASLEAPLYFRKTINGIRSLSDIKGFHIGVVGGSPFAAYLRDQVPFGTTILQYADMSQLMEAAFLEEIHVFVAWPASADKHLHRTNMQDEFRRTEKPVATVHLRAAVRADDEALRDHLNTLFASLTEEDLRAVRSRWQGQPIGSNVSWRLVAVTVFILLAIIAVGGLWIAQTRKMILRATSSLRKTNEQLEQEIARRELVENELSLLNRTLEREVHRRTRDLTHKAEELRLANRRLRELDTLKSDFLSSVSHELRTPLTSILGFAKLIRRDFLRHFHDRLNEGTEQFALGERLLGNLEIIKKESARLTRLINDVLNLHRIESGKLSWNDKEFQPEGIISHAVEAAAGYLVDKPGVHLAARMNEPLGPVCMDPDRLEQVLLNLISNGIKFTDNGQVTCPRPCPTDACTSRWKTRA